MHVQVWLGWAASIADIAQDIADFDRVASFNVHGAGSHMGIEDVTIGRDFDDDVIACGVIGVDRDDVFAGVRHIVRHAVGHTDHLAGGYTVDWLVVAEITVVLVFRAFPGRAHAVY